MVLLEIVCPDEQLVTYEMLYCVISLYIRDVQVTSTVILVLVTVLTDTSLTCTGTK